MADPGFPVGGGMHPLGGGVDLRCGLFSVKMYAKTKELGPIRGGVRPARPHLDPPMQILFLVSENLHVEIKANKGKSVHLRR